MAELRDLYEISLQMIKCVEEIEFNSSTDSFFLWFIAKIMQHFPFVIVAKKQIKMIQWNS